MIVEYLSNIVYLWLSVSVSQCRSSLLFPNSYHSRHKQLKLTTNTVLTLGLSLHSKSLVKLHIG